MTFISSSKEGNYVGNNSANRAIPHLGGHEGKAIILTADNGSFRWIIKPGSLEYVDSNSGAKYSVTSMDSTNFYVGNAASYGLSCNATGITYHWVMI